MDFVERGRENYFVLNFLDKYMEEHKGFICGGCFKNIFNDEKLKDIDVFFHSREDFESAVSVYDDIASDDKSDIAFYYENENVKAYKDTKNDIVIEFCCKIFGTPQEILDKFDFTITQFAYYKAKVEDEDQDDPFAEHPSTHIEYRVLMNPDFFEHLHTKRLILGENIPFPMSTLERMFRYVKYGYMPCRDSKIKIAQAINGLTPAEIEVSENLYDGMD